MISSKQLFKIYNLKSWKQDRFQIFISIIAITISVAILLSIQLIISINNCYIKTNSKRINEGDININLLNSILKDENREVLKNLKSQGYLDYTTSYKVENTLVYHDIASTVDLKFVDPENYPIFKAGTNYKDLLKDNNIIINKVTADKFNIKKGDTIIISVKGFSESDMKFKVSRILESTDVIDESILGTIIINKAILQQENIDNLISNVHIKVNKKYKVNDVKEILEKKFNEEAKITTVQDVIETRKKVLDKESQALDFIEILVIIVTGTGISVTTTLLTLKRKKDYTLLKVYGMNQSFLKDLIIYETFIICLIASCFGTILSFFITGFIEKSIIKEISLSIIISNSLLPMIFTVLFIIAEALIFTLLPIGVSKNINPISILREQNQGIKEELVSFVFTTIFLLMIIFSFYIKSIKIGGMFLTALIILAAVTYCSIIGSILLITKIKADKMKFFIMPIRNLNRQKFKFAIGATALVVTLILCGIIINLACRAVPNIMDKYVKDMHYNLCINTGLNNGNETEKLLSKEKNITKYMKSLETSGSFNSINGKSFDSYVKSLGYTDVNTKYYLQNYNNLTVEGLDLENNILKYSVSQGRWFNSKDKDKNYIVLGSRFSNIQIKTGDQVEFDIHGKLIKFKVIGIRGENIVSGDDIVYTNINTLQQGYFLDDNTSSLKYLIKCDKKNEKKLTLSLSKELKQAQVTNIRLIFDSLTKYIQKSANVFIWICLISIISAACLIGNILMIINFERSKEFLVLKVLGAKNKDIRKITAMEGLIIGGISGILGAFICEVISSVIIMKMNYFRYSPNFIVCGGIVGVSLLIYIISTFIVVNNIKIENCSELLRE